MANEQKAGSDVPLATIAHLTDWLFAIQILPDPITGIPRTTTRLVTPAQVLALAPGGGGAPTGAAGGVLAGDYPDPDFAQPMATTAALGTAISDEAAARQDADTFKADLVLLANYLLVDDFTWSNLDHPATFPPEAHGASHAADGDDPVTPAAIGAATSAALATETDNRQTADSSLTAQIAALDSDIDSEAATRGAADLLLAPLASPALTGTPTAPTAAAATQNTQLATTAFVHALIDAVLGAAPASLDTLKELADALGDDPNFAATMTTLIATKLAKSANLSDLANVATARGNLGLGTAATQNTGAFDASGAAVGAVTTHNADATAHGQSSNGHALISSADYAAMRLLLGLVIGTNVQAQDAELAAIAGLASAADKAPYFTGSGAAALFDLTSVARTFLAAIDAAAQRTTLGLGTAATQNSGAFDAAGAATSAVATHAAVTTGIHGLVNSGGFSLTIPANGTVALLAIANLFTVRQDIRAVGSSFAAGAYIPWITGDALPTLRVGALTTGNTQPAVSASSDSHSGVLATSISGSAVNGSSTSSYGVQASSVSGLAAVWAQGTTQQGTNAAVGTMYDGVVVATIYNAFVARVRGSGTVPVGMGAGLKVVLRSSTSNEQEAALFAGLWTDATHATRTSAVTVSTVSSAGALTERARFDAGAGADTTGFSLIDWNSGTVKRVKVGAADSGGVGNRMLIIPN